MSLYRTLATHEIRVLHILPDDHSVLECQVEYVSLDHSPQYHAISYTWQLPESDVPFSEREEVIYNDVGGVNILVDNHTISVGFNLWAVLKHIRAMMYSEVGDTVWAIGVSKETRLWVDALCINQTNIAERSSQVKQMLRIYQTAARVHCWLGPQSHNSPLGLEIVQRYTKRFTPVDPFNRLLGNLYYEFKMLISPGISGMPLASDFEDWMTASLRDPTLQDHWRALARIWQRSYWQRAWYVYPSHSITSKSMKFGIEVVSRHIMANACLESILL